MISDRRDPLPHIRPGIPEGYVSVDHNMILGHKWQVLTEYIITEDIMLVYCNNVRQQEHAMCDQRSS